MSYIKSISTMELADHRVREYERINSYKRMIEKESYNDYYRNEETVKEAIHFCKKELKAIESELESRNEVAIMTMKIDVKGWGIGFFENISTWEDSILNQIENDFEVSVNRPMDIEILKDLLKKYGYEFIDNHIYSMIGEEKLIKELQENFKNQ